MSSNLDDKTMHELYLWPFADAVKAGTGSVMCSYNRINGSYACQNSATLNGYETACTDTWWLYYMLTSALDVL